MTELAPHRNRTLYSDCDRNAARAKHNWRRRAVLARRVNHYRVGEQMDAGIKSIRDSFNVMLARGHILKGTLRR
jgi:hypothetical protein